MASLDQRELQKSFDEGLQLLSARKFDEGIQILQTARANGFTSSSLEANLGRALVERGDLGPGIANLMNAVALDRFESRNRSDLLLAQSKVESSLGTPMSHPAELAHRFASYIRPTESLALASIFLLAFVAARVLRAQSRSLALTCLGLALVTTGLGVFTMTSRSIAVLVKDAEVRTAPLEAAEVMTAIKSGTRLRVLKDSGEYYEVERAGSFAPGWLPKNAVATSPF